VASNDDVLLLGVCTVSSNTVIFLNSDSVVRILSIKRTSWCFVIGFTTVIDDSTLRSAAKREHMLRIGRNFCLVGRGGK